MYGEIQNLEMLPDIVPERNIVRVAFYEIHPRVYSYFEAQIAKVRFTSFVKYIGMALALTSFLWEYISPALRNNPTAAWISVFLSGAGLILFLYEKINPEEKIEEYLFPIVSIIEWLIPFVGFGDAVYNLSQTGGG